MASFIPAGILADAHERELERLPTISVYTEDNVRKLPFVGFATVPERTWPVDTEEVNAFTHQESKRLNAFDPRYVIHLLATVMRRP